MASLPFDNSFGRLPDAFYARTAPQPVAKPSIIRINDPLAVQLGLDPEWLASPEGLAMLSGNQFPDAADPIAMVYAGHQFGGWSGQLGDGRAVLLGEMVDRDGVRRDLQLKGSGPTPFSRRGDGRSPIGPVVREYLVSEAMAALGVPTTRALAAVATGEPVYREDALPGGVLARVATSHVRVGTFEHFHAKGERDRLQELTDYVIDRHYPDARASERPALAFLESVIGRQAELIAQWMQFGFIHGVMNTDNMQIAGETIDFGPCAFMEAFNPGMVFSSIDQQGRYAWANQPSIGQWNLTRLAEALLTFLDDDEATAVELAESALRGFAARFNTAFLGGFEEKLGLAGGTLEASGEGSNEAPDFLRTTFDVLANQQVDFTLFFRHLTQVAAGGETFALRSLFDDAAAADTWLDAWRIAVGGTGLPDASRVAGMRARNPIFIPRNHRVEQAIQSAMQGDYAPFERMTTVWATPYTEQPEHEDLEQPPTPDERVTRTFCGT